MDLQQRKLTKSEWDSIEKPIPAGEKEVLALISSGYDNVNVRYNKNQTIMQYLKIESTAQTDICIFQKYYADRIIALLAKFQLQHLITKQELSKFKKQDMKKTIMIKMQRFTPDLVEKAEVFENTLLRHATELLVHKNGTRKQKPSGAWQMHYYTLHHLLKTCISPNVHVKNIVTKLLDAYQSDISLQHIIEHSAEYIEQNKSLLQHADMTLFEHQKKIFTTCKDPSPKLILYTAPTGTGKTLTPIGLLRGNKVIFVCAARHVGLALAKSAINMERKVAFAFGCDAADDIRLHYFAAKDYTKNNRSGGIWKVDNSVGDNVELMICDVKSYLPAMYYMLAFNDKSSLITYWDEPTITMDYERHECHEIIQKNWKENMIPTMVLSSATLPKMHELNNTIADFHMKFPGEDTCIHNIHSSDCKKSIPLVNKQGYVVSPHTMSSEYANIANIVEHCKQNPVLMRYFDLTDISKCIVVANNHEYTTKPIRRFFESVDDVTSMNIKDYYLVVLSNVRAGSWGALYLSLCGDRTSAVSPPKSETIRKVKSVDFPKNSASGEPIRRTHSVHPTTSNDERPSSRFGTMITTSDAHTLTDGPTIFLTHEPEKIAKFCIQQANIPEMVISDLLKSIEFNNTLVKQIEKAERDLEDAIPKEAKSGTEVSGKKGVEKTGKTDRAMEKNAHVFALREKVEAFRKMIKVTQLNDTFVPNKLAHLEKWAAHHNHDYANAFTSSISDQTIERIMSLTDVSNSWKILLMMGIGVFTHHESIDYTEIMKELADQQALYLIIASGDYIYGTNYQFCHGYISKAMGLSQEKIIQAIGRVGRNGIQQKYTIRFRDDEPIHMLFSSDCERPEASNMNRLFASA